MGANNMPSNAIQREKTKQEEAALAKAQKIVESREKQRSSVQERLDRLEQIKKPLEAIASRRSHELNAAQEIVKTVDPQTDPTQLAQAMAQAAALQKILDVIHEEL